MPAKLSTESFIEKAKEKRTDIDFDYSKVQYVGTHTKVLIIDPDYGEFSITPANFLSGNGHPVRSGKKKLTTQSFIEKAKEKRTDIDFDYSKVQYVGTHTKVLIIDPDYGEFSITPANFLSGNGHPVRSGKKKLTTQSFIEKAKEKRTDIDFDYSKVQYVDTHTKVLIIDPEYGEFDISPANFLSGKGHPVRGLESRSSKRLYSTESFIEKAKEKRTDIDFDYSKVQYLNSTAKVIIIDPEYGEFSVMPSNFLSGNQHPLRGLKSRSHKQKLKFNTESFIKKAKEKRTDIDFDYSKVQYVNAHTKVLIIDPVYGEFSITPNNFLGGIGNPVRSGKMKLTTESFIEKAKEKRTDIDFDYSKVHYLNTKTKVLIIDPVYGEFSVTPSSFLGGSGHPARGGSMKLTNESFIEKAKEKRTDIDFDYSKVQYVNNNTKVLIIDPDYGEFSITPNKFLNGQGNPLRSGKDQKYSYISLVLDNMLPLAVKYGVETIKGIRTNQQNRNSVYDIVRIKTFKFNTSEECKAAELECKKLFQKETRKLYNRNGLISKQYMKDGWSETTNISNTDMIIEIYKKYNAVEVNI